MDAIDALGGLGDSRATPSLMRILQQRHDVQRAAGEPGTHFALGCAAVRALGELRSAEAAEELAAILERPTADGLLVQYAAEALARLGTQHALAAVARAAYRGEPAVCVGDAAP